MDSQPIRDERLLEALEACRPGSDDLADPVMADLADRLATSPQLRERYRQLQAVDARLAAAVRDVPVPEGLAQRIHQRLAAARAEQAAASDAQDSAEVAASVAPATPRPRRFSRRRLWAAVATLSASAALVVVAVLYFGTRDRCDVAAVRGAAVERFGQNSAPGYLLSDPDHPAPKQLPISSEVRRLSGTRWRTIAGFLGRDGVAYDLPAPDGTTRATLYVVKRSVDGLTQTQPPPRPAWNTGGLCCTAWQEGDLLYVLVVRGGRRAYDECLAPPGMVT